MLPAREWLFKFFSSLNKGKLKKLEEYVCSLVGYEVKCDFEDNEQITPVKLALISKQDLENPEYEMAAFGMLTGKACEIIIKTHKVWIPLLNAHMKQYGYSDTRFISIAEEKIWNTFGTVRQILE